MTKEQWLNMLEFVKAVDGKLLISMTNCDGLHRYDEPWNPSLDEKIFAISKEHGVPVQAVEFTNEPNMLYAVIDGYTPADFRRDQDLFPKKRENPFVKE